MTFKRFNPSYLLVFFVLLFLASCAPKVTFFVRKPPRLPVKQVETISIGSFNDTINQNISLPPALKNKQLQGKAGLHPTITKFTANEKAADLVRGLLVAGLSKSGQYRILNTGSSDGGFSGVIPDPATTGVINARVKFYEYTDENAEKMFYTLLAIKGGGSMLEQMQLVAAREVVKQTAEKSKKGFLVPTPFVEKIAALEIEFDLIRQKTKEKIVPTQVLSSYYYQKWGGDEETSHLPKNLKQVIISTYGEDNSFFGSIKKQAKNVEMAFMDPDEFLARGGKLKNNNSIPKNSLEIQLSLAKHIVDIFLKRISQYTVETTLKVASGDAIAVNYINANAYELAINRLENINRSEQDSFNLALAYESIAEYPQAVKYYQEALDKDPGNKTYNEALKRVKR